MTVGGKLIVLHDYEPQQVDELSMKKGDLILLKEEIEDGWAIGVKIKRNGEEYGPTNCFPTNFTKPYTGGVSDEAEGSIKSKKSSKVHYTPGGFHKYVEMMKSRPKAAGKRRKPSRAHRKLKNRLKWGDSETLTLTSQSESGDEDLSLSEDDTEGISEANFAPPEQDKNQIKRSSGAWTGSLTSILRNPSPDRKGANRLSVADDKTKPKDPTNRVPKPFSPLVTEETRGRSTEKKSSQDKKRFVSSVTIPSLSPERKPSLPEERKPANPPPAQKTVSISRSEESMPSRREMRTPSPDRRDQDHFYNDDEYFRDQGRVASPSLPSKPPVTPAMKMEELNQYYEFAEDDSILEDFEEVDENFQLDETNSFHFRDQYVPDDYEEYNSEGEEYPMDEIEQYEYEMNQAQYEEEYDDEYADEIEPLPNLQYRRNSNNNNTYRSEPDYSELSRGLTTKSEAITEYENRKIIKEPGPRWAKPVIEGHKGSVPAKWGKPVMEEMTFPWNKKDAKNPKTKGHGFQKNDHVHKLPSWISEKGKPKRIIAPLPKSQKPIYKIPDKPVRRSEPVIPRRPTQYVPNRSVHSTVNRSTLKSNRSTGTVVDKSAKIDPSQFTGIKFIRKNGKLYIPRHLKEEFARQKAMQTMDPRRRLVSDSTMRSMKSIQSQGELPKSSTPKKKIDPSKPMTRAEKIEFVKQQTELAKKVALRPHLAESDVLAAILDLNDKPPEPVAPKKAATPSDDAALQNHPIFQLYPLSAACRAKLVEIELSNPTILYSQTFYSIGHLLNTHKETLSMADCNSIIASIIVMRLVLAAILRASECGASNGNTSKPDSLLSSELTTVHAFKEILPNFLSPPSKKDFQRLSLPTRKFLADKSLSDLKKLTCVADQKQFRNALRKSMNAENMTFGEQAKLELLFQNISLEMLEESAQRLKKEFRLEFNKPKGVKPKTFHLNKGEIDKLVAQQMLKCMQNS